MEEEEGKISISSSEKSMSSSSSSSTTSTTTIISTEDSERRRESNSYFPDCRKDANCSCEICLDSLNATLDLMPLSVQRSSLTKLSYASNFKSSVESTPTSFDPDLVTTPASKVIITLPKKKSKVSKSVKKKTKNENRSLIRVVVLVIGLAIILELGFRCAILKPELTEEIIRSIGERSQFSDLNSKLRLLEEELKNYGEFSTCRDSNSKWKVNQDGSLLNSKCVLYKSAIEEMSIWGWPLQTAGLFRTGFFSSSITILSGRVTEWEDGRLGYTIREANTSWCKSKWSKSVLQLDPNTWVLEYRQNSIMESSSLLSLTIDLFKHMVFKNVNQEVSKTSTTMTPT